MRAESVLPNSRKFAGSQIIPFAVLHLYGGEQLPELPGASKKLRRGSKVNAPQLPLARPLRASRRRPATAARFAARRRLYLVCSTNFRVPRKNTHQKPCF